MIAGIAMMVFEFILVELVLLSFIESENEDEDRIES